MQYLVYYLSETIQPWRQELVGRSDDDGFSQIGLLRSESKFLMVDIYMETQLYSIKYLLKCDW